MRCRVSSLACRQVGGQVAQRQPTKLGLGGGQRGQPEGRPVLVEQERRDREPPLPRQVPARRLRVLCQPEHVVHHDHPAARRVRQLADEQWRRRLQRAPPAVAGPCARCPISDRESRPEK